MSAVCNCRAVAIIAAFTLIGACDGPSLNAQDTLHFANSPSLRLTGPSVVRAGDSPRYRAFLINDTKIDIQVLSPLTDGGALLEWKVVNVATQEPSSSPVAQTWCGTRKKFDPHLGLFMLLKPGQKLELTGIEIPDLSLRPGLYRISLRYALSWVVQPSDILTEQVQYSVTSNQLTVLFPEH